ncbi:MAG: GNAT family N-acetyltransferase [Dehalococcoidia bacterium]
MDGLTIRRATAGDADRIDAIVNDPPGAEAIGAAGGDPVAARRFGSAVFRMGVSPVLARTFVAEIDGRVVGMMDAGADAEAVRIGPALILKMLGHALRIFGPVRAFRAVPAVRARSRIDFAHVAGSYYIAELDVDPGYRNRGIGGALLAHAEAEARRAGVRRMSLTTTITNPARRLYERNGYRVAGTKTDAEYERITGVPGRVLMVKELT